jgi:hypothetical protein
LGFQENREDGKMDESRDVWYGERGDENDKELEITKGG